VSADAAARVRSVAWSKDDPLGAEHARVSLHPGALSATGVAIGSDPRPYRLDFSLETGDRFVSSRLEVATGGEGWRRRIAVSRDDSGTWSVDSAAEGELDLPAPGGEMEAFDGALDVDLGLSPVTNAMPVLRHELLDGGESPELLMVWVSVPDLALHTSRQRYTALDPLEDGMRTIRFEDDGGFVAEIVFDGDGLVVDYPGIATRIRPQSPDQ
jgi:uncharacterized protein